MHFAALGCSSGRHGPRGLFLALAASSTSSTFALHARDSAGTWRDELGDLESYTFERFVKDFSRDYEENGPEWNARSAIFEKKRQEAIAHNAQPDQTYKLGISKFMDWKDEERKAVLGYKGSRSRLGRSPSGAVMLRKFKHEKVLPASFSTMSSRQSSGVRDQGDCGSCWAQAAAAALEGQIEANSTLMQQLEALRMKEPFRVPATPTLSEQAIISCTSNPRHCGGTGGCQGATVELAYDLLKRKGGLPFSSEWKFSSGRTGLTPPCQDRVFQNHRIGITDYVVLPSNRAHPLKEALVTSGGPIAIAADATYWFDYMYGIFTDTRRGGDFQVNHAVTLVAYREPTESEGGWWKVRNSWGPGWGEDGHIRVEMKKSEDEHCGWDTNTHDGLACDGDPDTAWVCGTCGILYDSIYPTGLYLHRHPQLLR